MPIEIASPVSRLRSNIAGRAPLWVASAGIADSLYSLIALSRSLFLNLDLMTPACMFHLREKRSNSRCAVRSARWSSHGTRTVRHMYPSLGNAGYNPILLPALGGESRHGSSVGNKSSLTTRFAAESPLRVFPPRPLSRLGRALSSFL